MKKEEGRQAYRRSQRRAAENRAGRLARGPKEAAQIQPLQALIAGATVACVMIGGTIAFIVMAMDDFLG